MCAVAVVSVITPVVGSYEPPLVVKSAVVAGVPRSITSSPTLSPVVVAS